MAGQYPGASECVGVLLHGGYLGPDHTGLPALLHASGDARGKGAGGAVFGTAQRDAGGDHAKGGAGDHLRDAGTLWDQHGCKEKYCQGAGDIRGDAV